MLDRLNELARIQCHLPLVTDEDDEGLYEVRLVMNAAPLYARVFDTQDGGRLPKRTGCSATCATPDGGTALWTCSG
jgi:hypothetical protein